MEHLSRRTTNDVDWLLVVTNPTWPSFCAAKRILALSRELPVRIGRRALLTNRVGSEGLPAEITEEIAALEAERLPDVPQDDLVERTGAVGPGRTRIARWQPRGSWPLAAWRRCCAPH